MLLIVCLGNPGKTYANNRHNVGFMVGDLLIDTLDLSKQGKKFKSVVYNGCVQQEKVALIQPQTYMNLSGEAVQTISAFYKIELDHVLVIYDDVDLPFGTLRMREKGSAGTHNGMRSVIQCLGSGDFPRLRLGVGPVPARWNIADFVLSDFSAEELQQLGDVFQQAVKTVQDWIGQKTGAGDDK